MKKSIHTPLVFHSIAAMNSALGLAEPKHPLICLNEYKDISVDVTEFTRGIMMDFYKISYKEPSSGRIRYGQDHYDLNNGGLSFLSPRQLVAEADGALDCSGMTLLIHPDFLKGYSLAANIKKYGFFSYGTNESLQLTAEEREMIFTLFRQIENELNQRLDHFSQDVIISQIELLLNYSNRFYNRQFLFRKVEHHTLLEKMDLLLEEHFNFGTTLGEGLPTVQDLAAKLNVSPNYLSDLLRELTGMNAQQHIHQKLIDRAKEILSTTNLSVSQIAYQLGFEYPQSFNKLFKNKTNLSPLEFRHSFN
ncbi:AraC family transcriptional regulator [Pedobacter frigidisoli]|uniref:helix-turn-helix domain-containing protein n=1 Tax=Pedobacter frigidisoli TaxID=2530455 RepID=UPI00292CAB1C|nr:AraC family transcriptional regulator [Pedobacter frigidisoli]